MRLRVLRRLRAEPVTFVGRTAGKIVGARGPLDFGWDPVFEPDEGGGKTFAEMAKPDERHLVQGRALAKLKEFLVVHFQLANGGTATETPRFAMHD